MYPVELEGKRVRLREFRATDEDAVLEIIGDDGVTRWLSFASRDREQARAMLAGAMDRAQVEPRDEYYLAVEAAGAEMVGFARLAFAGVRAAKLGYAVRADAWGNGFATDATRSIIDFGFNELKLHRISAAIGPDNEASIAVIKKLGFQYEGRLRDHVFTNGAWRDSLLYSRLASE